MSNLPISRTLAAESKYFSHVWSKVNLSAQKRLRVSRNSRKSYSTTSSSPASSSSILGTRSFLITAGVGIGLVGFAVARFTEDRHVNGTPSSSTQSTRTLAQISPAQYDLSEENIEGARKELIGLLGNKSVSVELGSRISHSSTEWSVAPRGDLDRPCMIVYPRSTEEVSQVTKICHRRRIPSIGFSGGTSLEGTLAAIHGEICIDFSKMNKVLALHKRDMDVVVQPGVGYVELNDQLAREGLFFPPDPGPGAQIGGMISQGCSGTNAFRYGTMKDWVLGLTVVLADGTIIKTRHRPRKSSAGYNLTQLFVGSEGTLGYVTEATCKITSKPENVQVAVAAFPTLEKAVDTSIKLAQCGLPVAAMELLDDTTMHAVNEGGYIEKRYHETATLFLKFSGTKSSVREQIEAAQRFAKQENCTAFEFSRNDDEAASLWQARKTALWSLLAIKNQQDDRFVSADAAVPMSRLAEIIERTNAKLKTSGLIGSCLGHVGDGNFHTTVLYGAKDELIARRIIAEVQTMAIDMEGTVTGEHGIGLEYRDMLEMELGVSSVDAMRQIKLALDPLCLLNPDKMIRVEAKKGEAVQSY
jgi:D-lactate dehydrogenase (cytochrome)